MHTNELPYWLQTLIIVGREEDDDKDGDQNDEGNDDGDDGEEGEDEGSKGGSDKDGESDDGDDLETKVANLEKALRDERRLRRKAERDSKRKGRQKASEKNTEDDAETQKQLQAAEQKTQRLAAGLLQREVDTAILEEARRQGFIDPTDALLDDIRKEIDADQDEDDPTAIDIDKDSVKDAVKDLASRKKHLVGQAPSNERSGGKFRRKGSSDDSKPNDQTLQTHYPSLR